MERWRAYRHPAVYYQTAEKNKRPPKHRWRPSRRFVRWTSMVAGTGLILWVLLWSPIFTVREVVLAGETTSNVELASHDLVGRNMMRLSDRQVFREFLERETSLASLHLTRGFPHQLQITFQRRHPAIVWMVGEVRWSIDEQGVIFPYDETTALDRPVVIDRHAQPISNGQQLVSPQFVQFVLEGGKEIPPVIGGRLLYGEIDETTLHLRFVTEWGWVIIFDTARPLSGQLGSLALILKDRRDLIHEYVDLRLVGRAYLK